MCPDIKDLTTNENKLRMLLPEIVDLEPKDYAQAHKISNAVRGEPWQWRTYINALAFLGLKEWLRERDLELKYQSDNCSPLHPRLASVIDAVCNLQLGEFKVCILAVENADQEEIILPRAVVDLPEFNAHFYLLLEVWEEDEQVNLKGMIRHNQLVQQLETVSITNEDWNYKIPSSWFDPEPNHLVYYCQYLNPSAIPLPSSSKSSIPLLSRSDLNLLLSKLQSLDPDQSLEQSLTWEQGKGILSYPDCLSLIEQWQQVDEPRSAQRLRLREQFSLLMEKTVNAAQQLESEMSKLANSLEMYFLPTQGTPEWLFNNDFDVAIASLRNQGIDIPSDVQPIYPEFNLEGLSLRLCIATWLHPSSAENSSNSNQDWSLLLILGSQFGDLLPQGMKIQVSNLTGVVESPELEFEELFLYTFVEANREDKLVATIITPNGTSLTLPPLMMESE